MLGTQPANRGGAPWLHTPKTVWSKWPSVHHRSSAHGGHGGRSSRGTEHEQQLACPAPRLRARSPPSTCRAPGLRCRLRRTDPLRPHVLWLALSLLGSLVLRRHGPGHHARGPIGHPPVAVGLYGFGLGPTLADCRTSTAVQWYCMHCKCTTW